MFTQNEGRKSVAETSSTATWQSTEPSGSGQSSAAGAFYYLADKSHAIPMMHLLSHQKDTRVAQGESPARDCEPTWGEQGRQLFYVNENGRAQ